MSRYLSRLMSQTGVKIPGVTNATSTPSPQPLFVAVPPPHPLSSTADLTEQEGESPASGPPPAASVHGMPPHSLTSGGQTGPEQPSQDRSAAETPLNAAPAARDSQETERLPPPETRSRAPTVGTTLSPVAGPSGSPPPAGNVAAPAPTNSAIIQKVMAWVAGSSHAPERPAPTETRAPVVATQPTTVPAQAAAAVIPEPADSVGESALPIRSPSSRLAIPESAVRRSSTASAERVVEPQDDAWSIHIGAIHLTLEVPPEKPDLHPAQPRPVPSTSAPATRTSGSRLSRYYLRPF